MWSMRKRFLFILLAMAGIACGSACGQELRLNHVYRKARLSLNMDKLYNYNMYEHSRWGLGLELRIPLKYDSRYGSLFQNTLDLSAWGGYGYGDKGWKYGTMAALSFPRNRLTKTFVTYDHDIEKAGSHSFDSYNIFNTFDNSGYFSSRYSEVSRLAGGMILRLPKGNILEVDYRHSKEYLLFNAHSLLYPHIYEEDRIPGTIYDEMHLILTKGALKGDLLAGIARPEMGSGEATAFGRVLAQYSKKKSFKNNATLWLFMQGGALFSDKTPISRRFDLSGTGGSVYYFRNTLLTVRPNSFVGDAFVFASVGYIFPKPLWNLSISKPVPFVQMNGVWGMLYGADMAEGTRVYELQSGRPYTTGSNAEEVIQFTAPTHGLLEPVAGIDGLLKWGLTEMGFAAGVQLSPHNAPYHRHNIMETFCVMVTAKLKIEN